MKNKKAISKFWKAIRKSAARVKDLPHWTGAGIVLSDNFEGGKESFSQNRLKDPN